MTTEISVAVAQELTNSQYSTLLPSVCLFEGKMRAKLQGASLSVMDNINPT